MLPELKAVATDAYRASMQKPIVSLEFYSNKSGRRSRSKVEAMWVHVVAQEKGVVSERAEDRTLGRHNINLRSGRDHGRNWTGGTWHAGEKPEGMIRQ